MTILDTILNSKEIPEDLKKEILYNLMYKMHNYSTGLFTFLYFFSIRNGGEYIRELALTKPDNSYFTFHVLTTKCNEDIKIHEIIGSLFPWSKTPNGHLYWEAVYKELTGKNI